MGRLQPTWLSMTEYDHTRVRPHRSSYYKCYLLLITAKHSSLTSYPQSQGMPRLITWQSHDSHVTWLTSPSPGICCPILPVYGKLDLFSWSKMTQYRHMHCQYSVYCTHLAVQLRLHPHTKQSKLTQLK